MMLYTYGGISLLWNSEQSIDTVESETVEGNKKAEPSSLGKRVCAHVVDDRVGFRRRIYTYTLGWGSGSRYIRTVS